MTKTEKAPIPKVKPRRQAVLRSVEANRHAKQVARIDELSEKKGLFTKAMIVGAGTLAVLTLANLDSEKYDTNSTKSQIDTEQEGTQVQEGVTTIPAGQGDGYEMLVRKEAERSGLSDSEIDALNIQDLTYDAKQLNDDQMIHPNVAYFVPDIPDKPNQD